MVDWCHCRRVADRDKWLELVKKTLVRWKRAQTLAKNRQKTRANEFLSASEKCPLCKTIRDKEDRCFDCYNCIVNYVFEITCAESVDVQDLVSPLWVMEHTYKEQLLKIAYVIEAIEEMIEVLENGRGRVSRAIC